MEGRKAFTPIPWSKRIGAGAAGWATLLTFTTFITYGMYFFTDVVGMSAAFAGIVMMIGTIWDAVTDPTVGMISDRMDPQKGRRRRFLKWFAIPFGLSTWLLFTDWGFGTTGTALYFIVVGLFFYTMQTLIDVPYTSLAAEMTEDYDERSTLGSVRILFALFAAVFCGATLIYVDWMQGLGLTEQKAWSVCAFAFGLTGTISILVTHRATKGYENTKATVSEKFTFKDIVNGPLKNRPFRHVALGFIFAIVGQALLLACMTYYFVYCLGLSETQVGLINTVMWIVGIGWVWPVNKVSQRFSKNIAWAGSMGLWCACMIIFPFFINKQGGIAGPMIMFCILVVALNVIYQVVYALIPDCVEIDELKTGNRNEGMYYSCATVSQKVASAIATSLLGIVLTGIGYDAALAVQSVFTTRWIMFIFSLAPAIFSFLSMLCLLTSPLSKKRYKEVTEALERKRAGEKVDLNEFRDLIR